MIDQQSRNKREGKFIGYAQRHYPKHRDGGERVVWVRHFFRARKPLAIRIISMKFGDGAYQHDIDDQGRREVHALADSNTLVKIGVMP